MIRQALIITFLLSLPLEAAALPPIPFEPIGIASNDGWWYATDQMPYLGKANKGGVAFGFNLAEAYHVSALSVFMGSNFNFSDADPEIFSYAVYKGSNIHEGNPLPTGELVYQSEQFAVPVNGKTKKYSVDTDLTLKDDNWLVINGGSNMYVKPDGFELRGKREDFSTVHNPEPTTLAMFGIAGLFGAALRKRRV